MTNAMSERSWLVLLCVVLFVALSVGFVDVVRAEPPLRAAIVVGANAAAPGRRPLRFAHKDAKEVERVLRSVGGFRPEEVHLLLDPEPEAVLRVLDQERNRLGQSSREGLLFFYYAGHADEEALYPGGRRLDFSSLRQRLDDKSVSVRVGVVDTCRGGSWTGTRGLSETKVFDVGASIELSNEGSVLVASSSGMEDAHESPELQGGFFTHHWNAALRGAGDQNGDGVVTLNEAFEYAKALTIRDTAILTSAPQHPSYLVNLHGRRDLPLAHLDQQTTTLVLEQQSAPIQLIDLDAGVRILEIPRGRRVLRLAMAPGLYLARSEVDGEMRAAEIRVRAGAETIVREDELQVVSGPVLAARGFEPRPVMASSIPAKMTEIRFALGVRHGESLPGIDLSGDDSAFAGLLQINRGVTDRLQWLIPTLALAYRGGEQGGFEWIPWGGLTRWGLGYTGASGVLFEGSLGAGIDLKKWLSPEGGLLLSFGLGTDFRWKSKRGEKRSPTTLRSKLATGYSYTLGGVATLTLSMSYSQNALFEGAIPDSRSSLAHRLGLGAAQELALRSLPLVKVHLSDVTSLDGYAAVEYDFAEKSFAETYLLGATFIW